MTFNEANAVEASVRDRLSIGPVKALSRLRCLVALAVLLAAGAAGAQTFPAPAGRVNDFANLLPAPDRAALEAKLTDLERTTSAEVAVVTVRTLDGRTVEAYAEALFAEWGIGKKDKDNGVLVLVAADDREMRIEVGYGLEGILPDGLAGAVIRETFLPSFRQDDYKTGILDGTARVIDIVRRNEVLTPAQIAALDEAARDEGRTRIVAFLVGPLLGVAMFMAGVSIGARSGAPLFLSGMGTLLMLVAVINKAPRAWVVPMCVIACGVLVVGIVRGRRPGWRQRLRGSGRGSSGSGWVAGGSDRSSSSGSSSSFGGFGGGSSGGGGASGKW